MQEKVVEIYEALVAGFDGIEVKGKKNRYTAMNGNMFSFVDPTGLMCIRLSDADKADFGVVHGTGDVLQYGSVMRGYVSVPEAMLSDEAALIAVFGQAVQNARALKPKPTTRKKK